MKKFSNIVLAVFLIGALGLGSFQGRRIGRLREAEMFYRWILAESTQYRLFPDFKAAGVEPEERNMMDRPLFQEILDVSEKVLPVQRATDDKGNPLKKLIAVTSDETQDKVVWDLVRSAALTKQQADFLKYLREKKLTSVASQFDPSSVYGEEGANVGLGNIFFGFRQLAANFVWLQVDRYWHQGMMHRMVPLMKTCVWLDPNFVDAYLVGAWHLAYNATAKMSDTPEPLKQYYPEYGVRLGEKELYYYMAIDFLKDGIRKNPRNYKLYFDLGFGIYELKLKDYANAVKYLSEAIRHRHDRWVPRQLYIAMELNGQYEDALAGWEDYLTKFPDNTTAPRFIERDKALVKEKEADEAAEGVRNATDPATAEAARAEAERLRGEALKMWQAQAGSGIEEEPFAVGRIMRMKALKLIEEKRYLEAIAVLQNAWSKSASFADEALSMIIDVKLKAGIPLSVSEKKAVMRREEAEKYKHMPPEASSPQGK